MGHEGETVCNDVDIYRGNQFYDVTLRLPLVVDYQQHVPERSGILRVPAVHNGVAFATQGGYLMCIDQQTKNVIWDYTESSVAGIPVISDSHGLFVTLRRNTLTAVNMMSGEELWSQASYGVWALTEKYILADGYSFKTPTIACFQRTDGAPLWQYEGMSGDGNIVVENGIVIAKDSAALHALSEDTGTPLWKISFDRFLEQNFSDRLEAWKKRPGGAGDNASKTPSARLGCVINGTIYISWDTGIVAAIDAHSGELKWSWSFPEGRNLNVAQNIIYANGKLYLHDAQGRGSLSYLYSVDASSGDTVFYTNDKITPAGCTHAAIVGKYFIGASFNCLGIWDVETQQRVWLYEHEKGDIFSVSFAITPNGLIAVDPDDFCLHWFKSS